MRLSLWQSFSSNHSAPFTVVGVFDSAAEAQAAASRLNALRGALREWDTAPLFSMTTPEDRALAEALGIEWGQPSEAQWVDWLANPVTTVERVIFIDGEDSFAGGEFARDWVRQLGGQGLVQGELTHGGERRWVEPEVTCLAPTESQAAALAADAACQIPWAMRLGPENLERAWFDNGKVGRAGRRLTYSGTAYIDLADGLITIIAYLRAHGCTEIAYSFREIRVDEGG